MPSAIVTGATGILGREIVFGLAKDSSTWSTVHALSRSQKEEYPSNVKHDHIDLTSSAQNMAKDLKGVEAEYVFFAAYLAKDDEGEAADVNGAMLENFLSALEINGVMKKVKRVVLVTGAKQYGLHLGRPRNPMYEDDPWVEGEGRPPNFYYTQQRILHKSAAKNGFSWVVTYPNDVIGVAKQNFMNLSTAVAMYILVSKEMNQGAEVPWPGSEAFYTASETFTWAKYHADFCIWASQTEKAGNQAFNVVNGDVVSWQSLWPKMVQYFGGKVPAKQFADSKEEVSMELAPKPPIADQATSMGLEGSDYTKQSKVEGRVDLMKWSQMGDVKKAWQTIAEREGLDEKGWEGATWGFLQFVLGRNYDINISMNKAKKFGWTGFADTFEAFQVVFAQMAEKKIIPKMS